jgi:hypothetical protein
MVEIKDGSETISSRLSRTFLHIQKGSGTHRIGDTFITSQRGVYALV